MSMVVGGAGGDNTGGFLLPGEEVFGRGAVWLGRPCARLCAGDSIGLEGGFIEDLK